MTNLLLRRVYPEGLFRRKPAWTFSTQERAGCYRTASLLTGELAAMKKRLTDGLVEFAMAG
jgi:hypothetical protein